MSAQSHTLTLLNPPAGVLKAIDQARGRDAPTPAKASAVDPGLITHNQAREAAWLEAHCPFRHEAGADAATVEWNRQREAEWHSGPDRLEALLREIAPNVFCNDPPPLKIGVHVDLIALTSGEFDSDVVRRFLRRWVRQSNYLAALARGDVRRDLDGLQAGSTEVVQ